MTRVLALVGLAVLGLAPVGAQTAWRLDLKAPPPTATTTTLRVLVTEINCASGTDARGRVQRPDVFLDGKRAVVTYFVTPKTGAQLCPGNPDTPVALTLPEPLGERRLLDGGSVPAVKPALPCILRDTPGPDCS